MLSGKLTADYRAPAGDVRTGPKWFQPEHLPRALGMLDRLRPLCDKYHCSMAALIFAWTLAQSESLNLLVGIRRLETLYDTSPRSISPLSGGCRLDDCRVGMHSIAPSPSFPPQSKQAIPHAMRYRLFP